MNNQVIFIIGVVFLIIVFYYYFCKIIIILKNRSLAKYKGEDIFYRHNEAYKSARSEAIGCIVQLVVIYLILRNHLSYIRYQDMYQDIYRVKEAWFNITLFIGALVIYLIRLIYVFIYYKVPFVITDKYFIINSKIHRSSKIFYSYQDENMILAKEYHQGKINELLRISMNESKIIQIIRKYSTLKDISLITCIKEENDTNTSGH